jgi:G6PDH family F420-dependent oxidoreductase
MAGRLADGMFGLVPDPDVIQAFEEAGGQDKPRIGQVHVCWADDEASARKTALEWWPNTVAGGNLPWELPLPSHFEDATAWADEDAIAEEIVCGPDPERHVAAIMEFAEAGYDHIYFHQVGPDQLDFIDFAERELLPRLAEQGIGQAKSSAAAAA